MFEVENHFENKRILEGKKCNRKAIEDRREKIKKSLDSKKVKIWLIQENNESFYKLKKFPNEL